MKIKLLGLLLCFMLLFAESHAQGCSDAGFCTIGSLKPHSNDSIGLKKRRLSLILNNGVGDEQVYVFTPGIQYDNQLSKQWGIQAKLTGNFASGNLGKARGLGDLFLAGTYSPISKDLWKISFVLATKVPLNTGDIRTGNKPLPMQYQSSLGTVDIISGFTLTNGKWLFATAVQQPLTGSNKNTFLPVYWNTKEANKYLPSNDFKHKGDVLLRAGYEILPSNKWKLNVGLLGIFHLGEDTYIDGNISNNPIAIKGSDGLTLNGTAALWYKVNNKLSFGLTSGIPFVVRDVRPDGLTRQFVISPELSFKF